MIYPLKAPFEDRSSTLLSTRRVSGLQRSSVTGSVVTQPRLVSTPPSPRTILRMPPVSARLKPTIERIREIAQLEENWDSYGGRIITRHAVFSAVRWLLGAITDTIPLPQVVPTVTGGIQAEWHEARIDLEVVFAPDGRISASFEDQERGIDWEGDITSDASPIAACLSRLSE